MLSLLIKHYIQFREAQVEEQQCAAAHMCLFLPEIEFFAEEVRVELHVKLGVQARANPH